MGKFEIKEVKTGVKFNLKAGNGEIIATSEVYSTEASCRKGIESVRRCCAGGIEDQTEEGILKALREGPYGGQGRRIPLPPESVQRPDHCHGRRLQSQKELFERHQQHQEERS